MINKFFFTSLILLAFLAGILWYNQQYNQVHFPFNCLYSTVYTFNNGDEIQKIKITQDISFRSPYSAYFLLNGSAEENGRTYKVNRVVLLDKGEVEHEHNTILRYTVNSVNKKEDDNLSEDIFDNLMSEYTLPSGLFELYIYPQSRETYLLGGPLSYLSVCLRY